MSQPDFEELMSRITFNPDSEVSRRIRRMIEKKGRFPHKVDIGGFKFKLKIYGGLKQLPVKLEEGSKPVKHVWVNDVILRYLPYNIRTLHGKRYIVKTITVDSAKGKLVPKDIIFEDLTASNLIGDDLKDLVLKGKCQTVPAIKTSFRIISKGSDIPYHTIVVEQEPEAVNYIARGEKEVFVPSEGRYMKLPYYYVVGSFNIPEKVKNALLNYSRDFTRGFILELRVPSGVTNIIFNLDLTDEKSLTSLLKYRFTEYVHLALHTIINTIIRNEKWNPRDIEHFVDVKVDLDEEFRIRLKEIFSEKIDEKEKYRFVIEKLLPRILVKVVIGSKADLLKGLDWGEINTKELENLGDRDFECELIVPRCYIKPEFVEEYDVYRKIIIALTNKILDDIRYAADKVKTY